MYRFRGLLFGGGQMFVRVVHRSLFIHLQVIVHSSTGHCLVDPELLLLVASYLCTCCIQSMSY